VFCIFTNLSVLMVEHLGLLVCVPSVQHNMIFPWCQVVSPSL